MESGAKIPGKLLLHACCGPCSMEPVRLLRKRGIEPHLFYANSSIAPEAEYARRRDTIAAWAADEAVAFTEGAYDPAAWEATAGRIGEAGAAAATTAGRIGEAAESDISPLPNPSLSASSLSSTPFPQSAAADAVTDDDDERRQARCRACYRLRFEEAAAHAAAHGFDALGTTLSVSPYQYTQIIREELARACERAGIGCFFEDYSPHYAEATRRSREAGMYRQVYCGCRFSEAEARAEREERKAAREAEKAERAAAREAEEQRQAERRAERAAYDAKQARKRAVLKALREEQRRADAEPSCEAPVREVPTREEHARRQHRQQDRERAHER